MGRHYARIIDAAQQQARKRVSHISRGRN